MLADDELPIHSIVAHVCQEEGYEFVSAFDGPKTITVFEKVQPDLLILDVMMPGMDGFTVCKRIRELGGSAPILFLSAKGDIVDKGVGFDAGGDDYIVKPFSPEELTMRIRAHLRRHERDIASRLEKIEYEGLSIDAIRRKVEKNGVPIDLTPKEFNILSLLAFNQGEVFTRDQLTVEIWGEDYAGEILGVAVYIRRIREKIEDDSSKPRYLQTVWRAGYRFGD